MVLSHSFTIMDENYQKLKYSKNVFLSVLYKLQRRLHANWLFWFCGQETCQPKVMLFKSYCPGPTSYTFDIRLFLFLPAPTPLISLYMYVSISSLSEDRSLASKFFFEVFPYELGNVCLWGGFPLPSSFWIVCMWVGSFPKLSNTHW